MCGGPTGPAAYLAPLPFVECRECGLAFRPRAESGEVRALYEDPAGYQAERADQQFGAEFDARRRDARARLRYVDAFATGTRELFDVGAAGGAFLAEARTRGWRVAGVEPMPGAASYARERVGVGVQTGVVEDVQVDAGSLDAVTMWHVLEHIPEPAGVLARIATWLRPGGVVALEVPNAGSPIARRLGAAWPSAEPDVHVSQFTPAALRRLLERTGFVVEDVSTVSIVTYYGWAQRLSPRTLAHVVRTASLLRTPRPRHPSGHELLRAVGRTAWD